MPRARGRKGPTLAGPFHLSASSIDRFGQCEQRWLYNRDIGESELAKSDPLELGTLMHRLLQAWWAGQSWRAEWSAALDEVAGWDLSFEPPEIFKRAEWLMERYDAHYGLSPEGVVSYRSEVEFDVPLDGNKLRVRGYIDGLVQFEDGVWVDEYKTMGRWGRENRAHYDPQLGLYLYAAKEMGYDPQGARFHAVSTYRYKGKKHVAEDGTESWDEAPTSKQFKRIEVPYNQGFVDECVENARRVAARAKDLVVSPELAVKTVSDHCQWCPYYRPCLRSWEE